MSKLLVDFKDDHQTVLKQFLAFFAKKKDECCKQVSLALEDAQYEQRNTQLFTKVDFDDIMTKLQAEVNETVNNEVQRFYRMSGVMVQMLLYEAEQQNVILKNIDVAYTENFKALEQLKDYEDIAKIDGSLGVLGLGPKKPGMSWGGLGQAVLTKHQQLTSLADTQQQAALDKLEAENTRLKETVKDLQSKITELLAKKNLENQRLQDSNKDADMKLFELEQQVQMAQAEKS